MTRNRQGHDDEHVHTAGDLSCGSEGGGVHAAVTLRWCLSDRFVGLGFLFVVCTGYDVLRILVYVCHGASE